MKKIGAVAVTIVTVAAAAMAGRWLWIHYNVEPWTRDGRVRADVVLVSSDVDGLVTHLMVKDGQVVHVGDVLFVIDRPRYELALDQAKAEVALVQANLGQAERDARRDESLGTLVTVEQTEQDRSKADQLRAQLNAAKSQRDLAELNLQRTTVKATVNGVVTNLELQEGDYASVGHQAMALLNTDSIYVDGYFEETKLPAIQVGDRATVHLMGVKKNFTGRVEDIDAGIADRERDSSPNSLANVNPTFSWVRLAQRIPVRIKLDPAPEGIRLISGRTATVSIDVPQSRRQEGAI
ncbi:efflux RND transporter periplasmic adaptor subunit [Dyella flava]|uniref:HlyD family secretion protein n=1 Tax=Dyella flava TaxID=1920170 RepID=A0ABS2K1B2_9GAMM|nr:HlyD family secretion protein [Dyella flava]MBM7125027.1 HlyD family secretion protein [Dyella flava]